MAIVSSYPLGIPTITDTVIGTQYIENKEPATKQFNINDIIALVPTPEPVTLAYKVYTVLIAQSGVNAPTVTAVLENTIGAITWGYDTVGSFKIISSGKFTAQKTTLTCSNLFGNSTIQPFPNFEESTFPNELRVLNIDTTTNTQVNGIDVALVEVRVYN